MAGTFIDLFILISGFVCAYFTVYYAIRHRYKLASIFPNIFHTIIFSNVFEAIPFGYFSKTIEYLVILGLFIIVLASGYLIYYFGFKIYRHHTYKLLKIPLFIKLPLLVTILETLFVFWFSVLISGTGSDIGLTFSYVSLGFALVDTPLSYTALLFGNIGLTFVLVYIVTVTLSRSKNFLKLISIPFIYAFFIYSYNILFEPNPFSVAVVQTKHITDIEKTFMETSLEKRSEYLNELLNLNPNNVDFLLFHEDSRAISYNKEQDDFREFVNLNFGSTTSLDSYLLEDKGIRRIFAFEYNKSGRKFRPKVTTFPAGEYLPYFLYPFRSITSEPIAKNLGLLTSNQKQARLTSSVRNGIKYMHLLCGEATSYENALKIIKEKPDIVFVSMSLEFFSFGKISETIYKNNLTLLSRTTNTNVISNINGDASYAVSKKGGVYIIDKTSLVNVNNEF